MDLQTVLITLGIVVLSVVLLILLTAIAGLWFLRRKLRKFSFAKVGSVLSLMGIARRVLGPKRNYR